MSESLIQRKKGKKKAGKSVPLNKAGKKKTAKKEAKKTTQKAAKKPKDTKAKQKVLANFHAPSNFRFTAEASKQALELAAAIDLAELREAEAASDLTRIRKIREKAETDLKNHIQGEDPTGTLFEPGPGDAEG